MLNYTCDNVRLVRMIFLQIRHERATFRTRKKLKENQAGLVSRAQAATTPVKPHKEGDAWSSPSAPLPPRPMTARASSSFSSAAGAGAAVVVPWTWAG